VPGRLLATGVGGGLESAWILHFRERVQGSPEEKFGFMPEWEKKRDENVIMSNRVRKRLERLDSGLSDCAKFGPEWVRIAALAARSCRSRRGY